MAREFDGANDIITSTITAIDTGDWTLFAWFQIDAFGATRVICSTERAASAGVTTYMFIDATGHLYGQQTFLTTAASATDTNALSTAGVWYCAVVTFRDSDKTIRIYLGTLSSPMAEVSYSSQVAGVGTRRTSGVVYVVGNEPTLALDHDGKIALAGHQAREWTLGETERYRLGFRPVQEGTTLRVFLPLDSPTALQAEDLSGNGANGTVTGATVADGPPIPYTLGTPTVVFEAAGNQTFDGTAAFLAEGFLTADGELLEVWDGAAAFTAEGFLSASGELQNTFDGAASFLADGFLSATGELVQTWDGEAAFVASGFLSANGELVTLAPVALIQVGSHRGSIGSGVWQVQVRPRGGGGNPLVVWDSFVSGQTSLRLSDVGETEITVSNDDCSVINQIQPWEHEIHLLRDEETVAIRVPSFPSGDVNTTTFSARDLFTWLEHRVIPVTEAFENVPLSTIFQRICEDVLDVENSMGLTLDVAPTIAVATRLITEVSRRIAAEELNEIARTGYDYVVIGRTILAGPPSDFPDLPGSLLIEHLENAAWQVVGPKSISKCYLIGISEAVEGVAGGISPVLGLVEEVVSEGRCRDPVSALAIAEDRVTMNRTPQLQITGDLTENCPWTYEQLIPGVVADVRMTIGCKKIEERMRLTAVDTDFGGNEKVRPTFVSERAI